LLWKCGFQIQKSKLFFVNQISRVINVLEIKFKEEKKMKTILGIEKNSNSMDRVVRE